MEVRWKAQWKLVVQQDSDPKQDVNLCRNAAFGELAGLGITVSSEMCCRAGSSWGATFSTEV